MQVKRPTEKEAEEAVRIIIRWIGDNPEREGLKATPERVVGAFREYYRGYETDPEVFLARTFEETGGYDELVMLRNIKFESHCEHHLAPFIGVAHVAYLPDHRIIGISKLARVVDIFAKRLQLQERMTVQIANAIDTVLKPKGVAVVIEALHHCMTTRGIHKSGTSMVTSHLTGLLRSDAMLRRDFLSMVGPLDASHVLR